MSTWFNQYKYRPLGFNEITYNGDIYYKADIEAVPGLYQNDTLLVSWEDSGIDDTCSNSTSVINDTYPSTNIVVMPNTITEIAESGFSECGIEKVYMSPNIVKIGNYAFWNSSNLKTIGIPETVTYVGDNAFTGCPELKKPEYLHDNIYYLGNYINPRVLAIGVNDKDQTSLSVSDDCRFIGSHAFDDWGNLVTVDNLGQNVKLILESAFHNDYNLYSVVIPQSVKEIHRKIFSNCNNLNMVQFANIYGWSAEQTYPPVYSNYVDASNIMINAINFIEGEWSDRYLCKDPNYKEPGLYTEDDQLIETWADTGIADDCSDAKNIITGNYPTTRKIIMGGNGTEIASEAFSQMEQITHFSCGTQVTSIGDKAFLGCSGLKQITFSNGLTSIGTQAFQSCWNISKLYFPTSLYSLGERAFFACNSLTNIEMPSDCALTNIGIYCFANCLSLTSFHVTNNILEIPESAFRNCYGLTQVSISSELTSIGKEAFLGCEGLTEINVVPSVTSIGEGAFRNCYKLTYVAIPEGITKINDYTFNKCYVLNNIELPSTLTSIGEYAFALCQGLTSIVIPNEVHTIGFFAFGNARTLNSVTLGTKLKTIDSNGFTNCKKLTSISLPSSLCSLGANTFTGCDILTSVSFLNTEDWYMDDTKTVTYTTLIDVTDPATNAINLHTDAGIWRTKYLHRDAAINTVKKLKTFINQNGTEEIVTLLDSGSTLTIKSTLSGADVYWRVVHAGDLSDYGQTKEGVILQMTENLNNGIVWHSSNNYSYSTSPICNYIEGKGGYASNGFPSLLLDDFKNYLSSGTCRTATTSSYIETDVPFDKFFLPSAKEMYAVGSNKNEGVTWKYWEKACQAAGATQPTPNDTANSARVLNVHSKSSNPLTFKSLWLRSAGSWGSRYVLMIGSSGSVNNFYVTYNSAGVCPACIVTKD